MFVDKQLFPFISFLLIKCLLLSLWTLSLLRVGSKFTASQNSYGKMKPMRTFKLYVHVYLLSNSNAQKRTNTHTPILEQAHIYEGTSVMLYPHKYEHKHPPYIYI